MDLNLLRVFVAVYEARSLTVAAERLYVTQPAVSQSLGRLRRELGDPLFRRVGRAMEPTPLADAVFPGFRDAVVGVDRTLDAVRSFDPGTSRRRFRIALSELGEIGYLPTITQLVRRAAPAVRIDAVALDVDALPEWLAAGSVDLAVTSSPVRAGLEHVVLKQQAYGVLMSTRHPLAGAEMTAESYAAATHIVVAGDSGLPNLRAALRRADIAMEDPITVNHFASVPTMLVAGPDLIATVPDTIGAAWTTAWPLTLKPLPVDMHPVDVCLYRRTTTQHLAALDWLYDTVERALRGLQGEFFSIRGGS
ncbi:LysR family transcriptional regulator [Agromyces bauzanensis]